MLIYSPSITSATNKPPFPIPPPPPPPSRPPTSVSTAKNQTTKDMIAKTDDSLFRNGTCKIQTGLPCQHRSNPDTIHTITTGIQEDVAQLLKKVQSNISRWIKAQKSKKERKKL